MQILEVCDIPMTVPRIPAKEPCHRTPVSAGPAPQEPTALETGFAPGTHPGALTQLKHEFESVETCLRKN